MPRKCQHCGLGRKELKATMRPAQYFRAHESLCLGKGENEILMGIPKLCIICGAKLESNMDVLEKSIQHYKEVHDVVLDEEHDIRGLLDQAVLTPYDSMDFQRGWGASYSTASIRDASEELYQQARALLEGPFQSSPDTPMLQATSKDYIEAFNDYFSVDPMIFTMHASEAQFGIYSLYFSSLEFMPVADEDDIPATDQARLAWTGGCYGASYGPGAYISPVPGFSRSAWGQKPYILDIDGDIEAGVLKAKSEHCIAVVTEIFLTGDGKYITTEKWAALHRACKRNDVLLVTDESVTAIRTGYPFAFQKAADDSLDKRQPDLVIFGKGLANSGIGVNWSGSFFRRMPEPAREKFRNMWRYPVTRMLGPLDCIRGTAIIELARNRDWINNAVRIGDEIREILRKAGMPSTNGCAALIYVPHDASFLRALKGVRWPMPASGAPEYQRWMPQLDLSTADVDDIFSIEYRLTTSRILSRGGILRLHRCSKCGNYEMPELGVMICDRCCIDYCGPCVEVMGNTRHVCPDGRQNGVHWFRAYF